MRTHLEEAWDRPEVVGARSNQKESCQRKEKKLSELSELNYGQIVLQTKRNLIRTTQQREAEDELQGGHLDILEHAHEILDRRKRWYHQRERDRERRYVGFARSEQEERF